MSTTKEQIDELRTMQAQVIRMEYQYSEVRKDKERLDWLESRASVTFVHHVEGYVIATSRDGEEACSKAMPDLRAAIDSIKTPIT